MEKPETTFRHRIQPYLEKLPGSCVIPIQSKAIRGIPDLLICLRGVFVAIELKSDEGLEPDPLQKFWLDKISVAGGISIVANPQNWDRVYKFLSEIANQANPRDVHYIGPRH